jgi:hypothetical protein
LVNLKTIVGILLLVVSAFFIAILGIGAIILAVLYFALLSGFILLLDGLGYFGREGTGGAPVKQQPRQLSILDRTVLELISQNKSQDEIVRSTGVSASVVAEKSSALRASGYLSTDGLTEKGFEVLRAP